MDLVLNNLQRLIYHKPKQLINQPFICIRNSTAYIQFLFYFSLIEIYYSIFWVESVFNLTEKKTHQKYLIFEWVYIQRKHWTHKIVDKTECKNRRKKSTRLLEFKS